MQSTESFIVLPTHIHMEFNRYYQKYVYISKKDPIMLWWILTLTNKRAVTHKHKIIHPKALAISEPLLKHPIKGCNEIYVVCCCQKGRFIDHNVTYWMSTCRCNRPSGGFHVNNFCVLPCGNHLDVTQEVQSSHGLLSSQCVARRLGGVNTITGPLWLVLAEELCSIIIDNRI